MKRINILIISLLLFCVSFSVFSEDYSVNDLIPVDTLATVKTEKFTYIDFKYNSFVDDKGNGLISFGSVQNNTISRTAISINILLFDETQKNIGYLTYCTDKDVGSTYNGYKLSGNQAIPFSIKVSSKYFADKKSAKDVKYFAVKDENQYCQIGNYTRYVGLTIDEIINSNVSGKKPSTDVVYDILLFLKEKLMQKEVLTIIVVLICCIIFGMILNVLYKRMYGKKTALAYLPITNAFIASKMAFGSIVAVVYLLLYIGSVVLLYFKSTILFVIVNIILVIVFLIIIIKIITKKYDLLYFEPSMKTNSYIPIDNNISAYNNQSSNNEYIDLSYSDQDLDLNTGNDVTSSESSIGTNNDKSSSDLTDFFS